MRKRRLVAVCFTTLILILASCVLPVLAAYAAADAVQLPRLEKPLSLDGDLAEWDSAAGVPIRYGSYVSRPKQTGKWQGPADAGMEVYCAWNDDGICIAASVSDDDVFNDKDGQAFWMGDCIEFHFDGRAPDKLGAPTQEAGVQHVYYRPSNGKFPAEVWARPDNGEVKGVRSAGKRTPTGYTAEVLVPWSAFPAFLPKAGSPFGMQWVLCDYDTRDGKDILYPGTLSYKGAKYLRVKPQDYVKWVLADEPAIGGDALLGPAVALDAPQTHANGQQMSIGAEVSSPIASSVASAHMKAIDSEGKVFLDRGVDVKPLPKPWDRSVAATLECTPDACSAGFGSVEMTLSDKQGKVVGTAKRPVLFLGDTLDRTLAFLRKADLPRMSQSDPFRANAYMGLASAFMKLRRAVDIPNVPSVVDTMQELEARMDVLEDGKLDKTYPRLLDLLALTGDREAEVIVEYPPYSYATIAINWGSMPIVSLLVDQMKDAETAEKALGSRNWILEFDVRKEQVAGLPAGVTTGWYTSRPSGMSAFSPDSEVMVVFPQDRQAYIVSLNLLPKMVPLETAVVLGNCPTNVKEAVEGWAGEKKVPVSILDPKASAQKARILLAGDIMHSDHAQVAKGYLVRAIYYQEGFGRLVVAKDDRSIMVQAPTRAVADKAAELVVAGKPITVADVAALRRLLVDEQSPTVALDSAGPSGNLYSGDVHMHTTYSDGIASPVELALEGMYAGLDFMVISDHETVDGAQYAQRSFRKYGLNYPITVGEEISVEKGTIHANGYPLTKLVGQVSPEQAAKEVHAQGGVIQWNHPGWPPSDWAFARVNGGTTNTPFDAFEHVPPDYDRWQRKGINPVIVGSSDNHGMDFALQERTVILAPSAGGNDLAEAVRSRKAACLSTSGDKYIYGCDDMPYWTWRYITDRDVRQAKAERIAATLKNADIIGLITNSRPRR